MPRVDRRRVLLRIVGRLVTVALGLLALTTRRRGIGWDQELAAVWRRGEHVLVAFWHEGLVMMPFLYSGRRACIMVSHHPDGEMIARALRQFRIEATRGSSTRGWVGGLKKMIRAYRGGSDLAFAPDGPHGPPYVAKPGAIQMARATGARIFPVAPVAAWHVRAGSWDRLIVPMPWSRIVYAVGEPMTVPRDADEAGIEAARLRLEQSLQALQSQARSALQVRMTGRRIARATDGPV